MWNENFQFDVYVPQLAMVRFLVEDYDSTSDNEFVGQYSLPFNSLKMGKFSSWRWIFAEFMAFISPLTATQWWFIVFTLHKGTIPPLVEHREVNSNSAQRALRILLLSDHWLQPLCAPTQDTDTCLCSIRMETFCPQLDSLYTSWSLMLSEMSMAGMSFCRTSTTQLCFSWF